VRAEFRVAYRALAGVAIATVVAAVLLIPWRGADAAASVAIAGGIVFGNLLMSASLSALAGRFSPRATAFVAMPSFALRMSSIVGLLTALKGQRFIDAPAFAAAFAVAVVLVTVLEMDAWRRTPWLVLTFGSKAKETT
jgi:hypothetical protein